MFKIITIIGLLALALFVLICSRIKGRHLCPCQGTCDSFVKAFFASRLVDQLVCVAFQLCGIVLAGTGFYAALILRHQMTGLLLTTHVTAGGAFMVLLAAITVLRVESNMFRFPAECFCDVVEIRKAFFWSMVFLGFVEILTMMLSMIPVFGSDWQIILCETHRFGALLVLLSVLGYSFLEVVEAKKPKA